MKITKIQMTPAHPRISVDVMETSAPWLGITKCYVSRVRFSRTTLKSTKIIDLALVPGGKMWPE